MPEYIEAIEKFLSDSPNSGNPLSCSVDRPVSQAESS